MMTTALQLNILENLIMKRQITNKKILSRPNYD